jgi:hypothetical protein
MIDPAFLRQAEDAALADARSAVAIHIEKIQNEALSMREAQHGQAP